MTKTKTRTSASLLLNLAASSLCAAASHGCARVVLEDSADAGPQPPRVSEVSPAPGEIDGSAQFRVVFSAAMDAALLLADKGRSETVGLASSANAEQAAAALGHSRLSTRERALLVSARAELEPGDAALTLAPEEPLAPGDWVLLVAARLRDADGRRLEGNGARFVFTVRADPQRPQLVEPAAGAEAPLNLARVRVSFPFAAPGQVLTLSGPEGALAAGVAPSAPGEALLQLCASAPCAVLRAGEEYALALGGTAIPGAAFTAGSCARADALAFLSAALEVRDGSVAAQATLDWPAQVRLEVALDSVPGTGAEAALEAACAHGACLTKEARAACTPTGCASLGGPAGAPTGCAAGLSLDGLAPASTYLWRLVAEDDEGHRTVSPAARFSTLSLLPTARLAEVMAAPPPPSPRSDGEYIEIYNPGPGAVDAWTLALQGPDGQARPLLGVLPPAPVLLGPGTRALAVGASFDAGRYALPAGTLVLRASTQRLLGRGLADDAPPPLALVSIGGAGAAPVELDRFPGAALPCPAGASLERLTAPAGVSWQCGAAGGSPGRAP